MKRIPVLLAFLVLVVGCASAPGPAPGVRQLAVESKDSAYVHTPSHFSFPTSFGKFQRVAVNQYDSAGQNIGVGYNLDDGELQIALTLYVKPPTPKTSGGHLSLQEQFELEQAVIAQQHPGAQRGSPRVSPQTQNREQAPGYAVSFRYEEFFAGQMQPVGSHLYLFEHDGWLVKYRITYPLAQEEKANSIAQIFVSVFIWRGGA